jgi:4-carboxymuconolactone decarboxylase
MARRRAVLGDPWVDRSLAGRNAFNAEFQDLITRYAWGEIWTRPGLDEETRRLIVLAITVALGRWEEFDLHGRAALEAGVSLERIKEVLMQTAVYAGVPAANTAFQRMSALIEECWKRSPADSCVNLARGMLSMCSCNKIQQSKKLLREEQLDDQDSLGRRSGFGVSVSAALAD